MSAPNAGTIAIVTAPSPLGPSHFLVLDNGKPVATLTRQDLEWAWRRYDELMAEARFKPSQLTNVAAYVPGDDPVTARKAKPMALAGLRQGQDAT